ncbi:putative O-acyltransferase WSD1-like [Capsicum annuum]|uniref:putative late blight resistance protein homolog R1A-3 isoform X1 n=1 Tax=Capsicum annuum TaxID=4072 RepID=UPI001FB103F8|nr:putative late blight resistance protein homolog R1A-3 isoform X1 [Capsicum annuum]XP_047252593.1 putative late blight resistance protein homolog R1A-3 isoform X1 [Capsicum annuum]KAF3640333.1 putative O-acyltransferase WSD1-like [Capsicum annuum]
MAYAAITCLMRTIHQSMELTACDLQLFYEKLERLRAILEKPWKATADVEALTSLEAEITELAYSAEDMSDLESSKVFLAQNVEERSRSMWELFFLLEQALECIDSTMKQWMATSYSMKDLKVQPYSLAGLSEHAVEQPQNMMVGYETEFEMMLDQLTRGERELEVVSIVGMGGIGKTTLATKLYCHPHIMSHFDILAKATVSQEHCVRNILLALLSTTSAEPDDELRDRLQKLLKRKRYLVVIDDIWTTEAWDDIKLCFPDCNNGSRIILTTRNVEVTEYANSGKPPYHMRLMNFDESWSLLYEKVFAKDSFPHEFGQLGKQIAFKCGGLPLSIVVIGGLLSKIGKSLGDWQIVASNVSSTVSTDVDVQCMKVLALSYHYLPSHLKPCFLYFAIFSEDQLIFVDKVVQLWVAEGFLKVEEMKCIEEVAETCLNQLIDRSLISTCEYSRFGKIESCGMHDVTREFCLREAQNMNFVNDLRGKSEQNPCKQSMPCSSKSRGRISIHNVEEFVRCHNSEAYSFICFGRFQCRVTEFPFKLVRVLHLAFRSCITFPSEMLHLIHLRHLSLSLSSSFEQYREISPIIIDIPTSISCLFYLQTFILNLSGVGLQYPIMLPLEILTMPQLRHLHLDWNYLRSHEPTEKSLVLKNLQCFSGLNPRYCTGSFFRLFPNLKKLGVRGVPEDFSSCKDMYDFSMLDQIEELEFLVNAQNYSCFLESTTPSGSPPQYLLRSYPADDVPLLLLPPSDAFPQNLKSLALSGQFFLPWKDLSIVGKIPKLESLKLSYNACEGVEWEVADEGFPRLKFLQLNYLGIRYWRANSDHFPCLERLFLYSCWNLDSIPHDFVDITTLALIDISYCQESVGNSARQIQQDIQDNYGCSFEVHTRPVPPADCLLSPIGLPLRPGQPLCIFYCRYGICKFGSSCKFDHPMTVQPPLGSLLETSAFNSARNIQLDIQGCSVGVPTRPVLPADCLLSPIELPLHPGQPLCMFYSRYGTCNFGSSCKFDHPIFVGEHTWGS